MEATLEEFGILYPKYATSLFEESCEVIEPGKSPLARMAVPI